MNLDQSDDIVFKPRLAQLAVERRPAADLWPGIAARLSPQRPANPASRRWPWVWGIAASTLLALGLVLVLVERPASPLVADRREGQDPTLVLIDAYVDVLELSRSEGMQTWLAGRPGAAERLAAARELDASMAGLAAALRIEPESQLIRRLLHQTLQQRIALMRLPLDA